MLTFIMRIQGISSFLEYLFNVYGICLELLVMVTTVKHTHIHHCPWDPRFHKVKGYFIPFVHYFFFFVLFFVLFARLFVALIRRVQGISLFCGWDCSREVFELMWLIYWKWISVCMIIACVAFDSDGKEAMGVGLFGVFTYCAFETRSRGISNLSDLSDRSSPWLFF